MTVAVFAVITCFISHMPMSCFQFCDLYFARYSFFSHGRFSPKFPKSAARVARRPESKSKSAVYFFYGLWSAADRWSHWGTSSERWFGADEVGRDGAGLLG